MFWDIFCGSEGILAQDGGGKEKKKKNYISAASREALIHMDLKTRDSVI